MIIIAFCVAVKNSIVCIEALLKTNSSVCASKDCPIIRPEDQTFNIFYLCIESFCESSEILVALPDTHTGYMNI